MVDHIERESTGKQLDGLPSINLAESQYDPRQVDSDSNAYKRSDSEPESKEDSKAEPIESDSRGLSTTDGTNDGTNDSNTETRLDTLALTGRGEDGIELIRRTREISEKNKTDTEADQLLEKMNSPQSAALDALTRRAGLPGLRLSKGLATHLPDINISELDIPQALLPEAPDRSNTSNGDKLDFTPPDSRFNSNPLDMLNDLDLFIPEPISRIAVEDSPTSDNPGKDRILPDNVKLDDKGRIGLIEYPNGVSRQFSHTANGELSSIIERSQEGTRTFIKRDGEWFLKDGDKETPLSGEIELRENGDFCLRADSGKAWQIERADGTMAVDRPKPSVNPEKPEPGKTEPKIDIAVTTIVDAENEDGSRQSLELTKNAQGNLSLVRLPDGSSRRFGYDESGSKLMQITDRVKTADGEKVEQWSRKLTADGELTDEFVRKSDTADGAEETRKDIKIDETGKYTYTDKDGESRLSRLPSQTEKIDKIEKTTATPWNAESDRDEHGRFKFIENERFRRDYTYFEGTDKIKSYTVVDKKDGRSATWSRNSPDERSFTGRGNRGEHEVMRGEFVITPDGVHQVNRDGIGSYGFLGNGIKADLKTDDSGALIASEGGKVRYVRRPDGSCVSYTNHDQTKITVFDNNTGERTNWSRGESGSWKSDSRDDTEERKDVYFNERGELTLTDNEGIKRTRTLEGHEIVEKGDGSKLLYDGEGKLLRVMYDENLRVFEREDGKVVSVADINANGEKKSIFPPPLQEGQELEDVKLSDDGILSYKIRGADGKILNAVTEATNGNRLEHDENGNLSSVRKPNGFTRRFEYQGEGADKVLTGILDTRPTSEGDKSTAWRREIDPDTGKPRGNGEFHSKTDAGKDRTPRSITNVLQDGTYEYKTAEDKPDDKPRLQRLSSGEGYLSESVEEAHIKLLETMESRMEEPRYKRMEEMMKAFEERMQDRAVARKLAGVEKPENIDKEITETISRTYDNLAELVSNDGNGTFFDKQQRLFLAENFMFHAQDPSTMDQGPASRGDSQGHGTCWIQAAHIWGMTQRTDHMADLVKQVALTGSYTTKNSGSKGDSPKTINFSRDYLKFPEGYQESNWSISKATDLWDRQPGLIQQVDGHRSPVGKIFDFTLPVIGGRSQSPGSLDGGTHESFNQPGNRWYVGNGEIMQMVTGDKPCDVGARGYSQGSLIDGDYRKTLLEKGTVLNYLPGHMRSQHLKQIDGQWVILQDDQHGENKDRIIARITDLERWAKGDNSAERQVREAVNHRKYKLETDYSIKGSFKPSPDAKENNESPQNDTWYVPGYRYRGGQWR